jgi:predicted metal-dependent HD superfamily phosphohydrolase
MFLKHIFVDLLNKYQMDQAIVQANWHNIYTKYTLGNRHYHTLSHLQKMYEELAPLKSNIQDWDSLLISLFYHDVIYDSSSQDNELQSALYMEKELAHSQFLPIEKCKAQILATKTHETSTNIDTNFLLDADLCILGSPWLEYKQYAHNVRQEYKQYPNKLYEEGRIKVLQHFIRKAQIYQTPHFRSKYDQRARKNLQQEIDLLLI